MPDAICNTSPVQYLHQLDLLEHALFRFYPTILIPPAVRDELRTGKSRGANVPTIDDVPNIALAVPQTIYAVPNDDLHAGERQVLALAIERRGSIVIFDDAVARMEAARLQLPLTGTLGILLEAKRHGIISSLSVQLTKLRSIGFHLNPALSRQVLKLADE